MKLFLDPGTLAAFLDALGAEYAAGDPNALLLAVKTCLRERCAVPEWAAEAFLRRLGLWHGDRVATLDEALGFKPKTLAQRKLEHRRVLQSLRVLRAMRADRQDYPEEPIGNATFERIGAACGISTATAKRRYYLAIKSPKMMFDTPSLNVVKAKMLAPYAVPAKKADLLAPTRKIRRRAR